MEGLQRFRAYFWQLAPPQFILQHLLNSIEAEFQQKLYEIIENAVSNPHPPPPSYLRRLLKALIAHFETQLATRGTEDDEINEGIMELYMEYLSAREGKPTDRVGVRYLVPKFDEEKEVLILESPNLLSGSGTTGLRTWEAARALGELLSIPFSDPSLRSESESNEKIPQVDVRGKKVLELGAGTGFVSILASKLGAEHVYSTDGDSGVVQYLQENIQLNDAGALVTGFQKWWGEESPFDENLVGLDWILAADVTYDPSIVPLLITELEQLHAKNPEAKMIVAATMRNFDTFECFNKGLDEAGFKTKQYTWTVEEGSLFYYQSSTPIKLVFITK